MTAADRPRFVTAFDRLTVATGRKAADVVDLEVYFAGLQACAIEFVVLAAEHLEGTSLWFPKVVEWRAAVARIEAERRAAHREVLRKLLVPLCAACRDTGWREVGAGTTAKGLTAPRRVEACDCQDLRRQEILGRHPWPSLPAAAASDTEVRE